MAVIVAFVIARRNAAFGDERGTLHHVRMVAMASGVINHSQ